MKKLVLLLVPLLFVILLAGCSGKKTLSCSNSSQSVKIVYDKEKVLEVYENGEKATNEEIELVNGLLPAFGGIDKYIESVIENAEADGGTCKR